jgi:hypothetical protein
LSEEPVVKWLVFLHYDGDDVTTFTRAVFAASLSLALAKARELAADAMDLTPEVVGIVRSDVAAKVIT